MKSYITVFFLLILLLVSSFTHSFAQYSWTKDPNNPVFSGVVGTWYENVILPFVLYNSDSSRYEMWFTASTNGDSPFRIGFAVSPDGIAWTEHPSPVLEPDAGTWDEATVEGSMVLRENGEYKMWYTSWSPSDNKGKIGYATSSDGINWTKYSGNPIMVPDTAAWEAGGPLYPGIIIFQGGYKMWYAGYNVEYTSAMIGYATSSDGITWQRDIDNNPVLTIGAPGEWDFNGITTPHINLIDSTYHLWYTARPYSGNPRQVGYASSDDGITWTKYNNTTTTNPPYLESDPVLKPSPGQWDGEAVTGGNVILIGDILHMWYDGYKSPFSSNPLKIGFATTPITALEEVKYGIFLKSFALNQNYPNPFNPSTTIKFTLPKSEYVELKVYNILGKEVATLVSIKLNQGNHTYQFDGKNLASGIYYYQLVAGEYREVKKMILIK
jgi:predicted GH43/DUF377 family glycosyl hydrolase